MIFKGRFLMALAPISVLGHKILIREWDSNWDQRDGDYLKRSKDSTLKSSAKKIFLIRHGQYVANHPNLVQDLDNDEQDYLRNDPLRPLTKLGRDQAHLTGLRLAEILQHEGLLNNHAVAVNLYSSDMVRAKETATIIKKCLEDTASTVNHRKKVTIEHRVDSILREGPPIMPSPPHSTWNPSISSFATEGARIEAAFRKFFFRPEPVDLSGATDGKEKSQNQVYILVGHGNVWRYCFLRALQLPADAWLSLSLYNASITRLQIKENGHVSCSSLGEVSHFPPSMITYS